MAVLKLSNYYYTATEGTPKLIATWKRSYETEMPARNDARKRIVGESYARYY